MPVRDRLSEMQKASKYSKDIEAGLESHEMTVPLNAVKTEFEVFLSRAEDLATDIASIEKNVVEMKLLQKKTFNTPVASQREKFQAELNDLIGLNKQLGRRVQTFIRDEQARNDKLSSKSGLKSSELSELHIRKVQVQTHSKRFLDVWTDYNNIQTEYRDKTKKQLVNNIKITGCQLSNEQIEEKIDAGDLTGFSTILQETAKAKDDLVAIENRHAEMLKLEKGIVEIHDMFIEISNLVSQQGEIITRIDYSIQSADENVKKGKDDLKKAEQNMISANKKKVCLISTAIIIVLILIVAIAVEFGL